MPLNGQGDAEPMAHVSSNIDFIPGTRHAKKFTFSGSAGAMPARSPLPCTEVSLVHERRRYGHETFGHGFYHGGPASTYEEYALSEVDDAHTLHIQAICDTHMTGSLGERHGHGVLEQLIIGPHQPSGFTELLDMAP